MTLSLPCSPLWNHLPRHHHSGTLQNILGPITRLVKLLRGSWVPGMSGECLGRTWPLDFAQPVPSKSGLNLAAKSGVEGPAETIHGLTTCKASSAVSGLLVVKGRGWGRGLTIEALLAHCQQMIRVVLHNTTVSVWSIQAAGIYMPGTAGGT
jgi:hypothetical protein